MKGEIARWKDERGFGFIVSEDGDERIFFHITAVRSRGRRPQEGDVVFYESAHDAQGRPKACDVVIEGVAAALPEEPHGGGRTRTGSPQRDILNGLAIMLLGLVLAGAAFAFIVQPEKVEYVAPTAAVVILAMIALLKRRKGPKAKEFTCTRCKEVSRHNTRTIRAWNNGLFRLYCDVCHQNWLAVRPPPSSPRRVGGRARRARRRPPVGGLLGALLAWLIIIFIIVGVGMHIR